MHLIIQIIINNIIHMIITYLFQMLIINKIQITMINVKIDQNDNQQHYQHDQDYQDYRHFQHQCSLVLVGLILSHPLMLQLKNKTGLKWNAMWSFLKGEQIILKGRFDCLFNPWVTPLFDSKRKTTLSLRPSSDLKREE